MEKEVTSKWLGGFFDADGCVLLNVRPNNDVKIGYSISPCLEMSQTIDGKRAIEQIKNFLENRNINYVEMQSENPGENSSDVISFRLNSWKSCNAFYEEIEGECFLKDIQLEILFEEIKPLFDKKEHLNKRGFLKIMVWRDLFNSYKTKHSRSKYDLEYFENLWDIELSQSEIPNTEDYEIGKEYELNNKENRKEKQSGSVFEY